MPNTRLLWHENKTKPPKKPEGPAWFKFWIQSLTRKDGKKHVSPSEEKHNEIRKQVLTDRQKERIRIMTGAFNDEEVDEKVALGDSKILRVERADVLVGQGGKYLHPRLFRVI